MPDCSTNAEKEFQQQTCWAVPLNINCMKTRFTPASLLVITVSIFIFASIMAKIIVYPENSVNERQAVKGIVRKHYHLYLFPVSSLVKAAARFNKTSHIEILAARESYLVTVCEKIPLSHIP